LDQIEKSGQITQGTSLKNLNSNQGRLTWFDISFVAGEQCRQTRLGAHISHKLGHIFHWNLHKLASPRCQEEILHKTFGEIRTLWSSAGARTRVDEHGHVFDASWCARARPRCSAHARSPAPCQPHAHARNYKSHPSLDRTPPRVPDPTRAQVRRRLPKERHASGRTSHGHCRPAKPAAPRPTLGLASVDLGEASRAGD
jgi:hypothetical protein